MSVRTPYSDGCSEHRMSECVSNCYYPLRALAFVNVQTQSFDSAELLPQKGAELSQCDSEPLALPTPAAALGVCQT